MKPKATITISKHEVLDKYKAEAHWSMSGCKCHVTTAYWKYKRYAVYKVHKALNKMRVKFKEEKVK